MKKILTLFIGLIFTSFVLAQNAPNDCVNALVVCGNGTFSSNADGIGNIQEVAGCSSSEHNSLWIKINIVQSGTLGFDLIPNDPDLDVDYDFWVYGPNATCGSLGSPIRCCTTNPGLAGLPTNHTGLNNTSFATTSGNGANGNGYVFRLSVTAGQSYYIAIDRPHGDGGFQIQWNGTAMAGTGAFPTPPTANQIPDLVTCSVTPNVGIFNLNTARSRINSDLTNNTINFYATLANATDGIFPLPDIYGNTSNSQHIYAKVTNNVSGCFTITDFNLRVVPVPTADISVSRTQVCSGENVTVIFSGTPGATVEYKVNGGAIQTVLLDATGTQLVQPITVNTTYSLVRATMRDSNNAVICFQSENDTASVTVSTLSAPTVTTNSPICEGGTAVLNFSGLANAVITYAVNGATAQTVRLDGTGRQQVSLSGLPSGSNVITVSNITDSNSPNCSLDFIVSETVIVNPTITATISGTTSVCQNASSPTITITGNNGTAPYTFVYTINAGPNQTITTTSGNSVTITPPTNVVGTFTYQLVNASSSTAPMCGFFQTGNVVITVNAPLTISGQLSACQGGTTQLTGSGTPDASNPWVSSDVTVATVSTSGLVTGLGLGTSVITYTDSNGCFNTVRVTINPNVVPTFTQVAPICNGGTLAPLPTTSNEGIRGSWSPALDNTTTTTYIFTPTPGLCATTANMTIVVNPAPNPQITDGTVCIDANGNMINPYTIDTHLTGSQYQFDWYLEPSTTPIPGEHGSTYVATEAGDYTVEVFNNITGCYAIKTVHVSEANPALDATVVVTDYFEDNQTITVVVIGNGTYLYSLDGAEFQESNVFQHVLSGEHTVDIIDTKGCTERQIKVITIGYPHFFTPNGDGYNDDWNISDLNTPVNKNAEIMIFDRYGKLIKQIVPSGQGWDGTYNGQILPATDYWFTVKYLENSVEKLFKAHFSMKR